MLQIQFFITLLTSTLAFGATIIDSDLSNDIDPIDEECSSLTPELVKEIQAYQPLVNEITNAIVNGKFSGDTWNA